MCLRFWVRILIFRKKIWIFWVKEGSDWWIEYSRYREFNVGIEYFEKFKCWSRVVEKVGERKRKLWGWGF